MGKTLRKGWSLKVLEFPKDLRSLLMETQHTSPDHWSLEKKWTIGGAKMNIMSQALKDWISWDNHWKLKNQILWIKDWSVEYSEKIYWLSWVKHCNREAWILRSIMFGGKSSDLSARTFFARFFTKVGLKTSPLIVLKLVNVQSWIENTPLW